MFLAVLTQHTHDPAVHLFIVGGTASAITCFSSYYFIGRQFSFVGEILVLHLDHTCLPSGVCRVGHQCSKIVWQ